jgi:hypothetical protein
MTSPCFIIPSVVVLVEKEGVTKPDVPNSMDGEAMENDMEGTTTTTTTTTTMMKSMMMRLHVCCSKSINFSIQLPIIFVT